MLPHFPFSLKLCEKVEGFFFFFENCVDLVGGFSLDFGLLCLAVIQLDILAIVHL